MNSFSPTVGIAPSNSLFEANQANMASSCGCCVTVQHRIFFAFRFTLAEQGLVLEQNQGERVVMQLAEEMTGSGRNSTTDHFFCSLSLAQKLLDRKMTLLGTIINHKWFRHIRNENHKSFLMIILQKVALTLLIIRCACIPPNEWQEDGQWLYSIKCLTSAP